MFKTCVAISIAAVFVGLLISGNAANADTLTGCLKPNGTLVNLAVGDTPSKPCKPNETEVSLRTEDTQKYIFVSSLASKGNVGGLSGANSICQDDADDNSLPGVYKAWLSLTTDGPQSTFVPARVPYVLPGSFDVVADDWTELTSGALAHAIDRHADGTSIAAGQEFWTGTRANGLPSSLDPFGLADSLITDNCVRWFAEISERSGVVGTSGAVDSTWSDLTRRPCNTELRHICVQQ